VGEVRQIDCSGFDVWGWEVGWHTLPGCCVEEGKFPIVPVQLF